MYLREFEQQILPRRWWCRCWVNPNSTAMLFPGETHLILGNSDGTRNMNIVLETRVIILGDSDRGDVAGPFKDAYVQVDLIRSDQESCLVEVNGLEGRRVRIPKDWLIFASTIDPIWEELKRESVQISPEAPKRTSGELVVDLITGTLEIK